MKLSPALALFAAFAITASADTTTPTPTAAPTVTAPKISDWKAGIAAIHGNVKDQGDVGFCWANAWTSYLESKLLIEKQKAVNLSAMWVGRSAMADAYRYTVHIMLQGDENLPTPDKTGLDMDPGNILSRYKELMSNPVESTVTKEFFTRKLQNISPNFEGRVSLSGADYGVVPTELYEKHDSTNDDLGPIAVERPPFVNQYQSPVNEYKFQDFISDHLLNLGDMKRYLADDGEAAIESDFDKEFGNKPISRDSQFTFENKTYTPASFLSDYIGFDASQFVDPTTVDPNNMTEMMNAIATQMEYANKETGLPKMGSATPKSFDKAVAGIQNELDHRRPVVIAMTILDDADDMNNILETGVLDPFYCKIPGKCEVRGGHAVLIVNSLKDSTGAVKAFVIQNSWGPIGTDENAVRTHERAKRGFNIVTLDYLKASMTDHSEAFRFMTM